MKLLITGAGGQLGRSLRRLLDGREDAEAVFTDIGELDITKADAVERMVEEKGIDSIINCAAYTAVDRAEGDKENAERLNAEAPGILARAIERRGGRMVHISTDYVFGGTACTPYRESDEPSPHSVYGRTKLKGERAVTEANGEAVVVRTAWLYSAYGKNFVKTMLRLMAEKKEIGVVYDQIGTPTYAPDLAEVCLRACSRDVEAGIYHYSNEGAVSWYDFAQAIARMAGLKECRIKPLRTEEYPTAAERPHYSVLDKAKARRTMGLEPIYWEDSLRKCFKELGEECRE